MIQDPRLMTNYFTNKRFFLVDFLLNRVIGDLVVFHLLNASFWVGSGRVRPIDYSGWWDPLKVMIPVQFLYQSIIAYKLQRRVKVGFNSFNLIYSALLYAWFWKNIEESHK